MRIFRLAVASIIVFLAYCHITTAKENIAIEHSKNIPIERTILPIISYSGDSIMIDAPHSGTGKRVFEYFRDYQCPACTQFSRGYLPVIEQFARDGALQLVYRQYPLADLHQNAHRDALASLCTHEQGVSKNIQEKSMFLNRKRIGRLFLIGKDSEYFDEWEMQKCSETASRMQNMMLEL